jgi:hypothetical protein
VQGLTSIIRDASFNVAHWEFAFKYFTISYEVPLMLKGEETIDAPFLYSNFFYYSMVAFNCLVAVLSGIDFVIYNFAVFQLKDVSVLIVVCAEVLHFLIGLA